MRPLTKYAAVSAILFVFMQATPVRAQLSGHNIPGDFGMKSGSQAPPGFYAVFLPYWYSTSTIVGGDGRELELARGLDQNFQVPLVSFVTGRKILGANYGFSATFPFANIAIEAPRLDLATSDRGYTDMWVQPLSLGWHLPKADVTAWYAFYAPTGRYNDPDEGNLGLGMWSHELALGTTHYFDESKRFHAAALGSFEFHSDKEDSDTHVGTLLTIEGGAGTTVKGFIDVGLAYYLQWKLTDDSGLELSEIVQDRLGKNQNFGFGPEIGIVLPLSEDFRRLLLVNFRYLFETGTSFDTRGDIAALTITLKAF